jgi:hypothetical protein
MSIYSYIYCVFYRFWGNKIGNGRIIASAHVAFTLLMHMLFFSELLRTGFVRKVVKSGGGSYPVIRDAYWLIIIFLILIIFFIYNPERSERLMKEYNIRYKDDVLGNVLRLLFYLIIPTVAGILLALIRHRVFV